jgi:hypothetical protein
MAVTRRSLVVATLCALFVVATAVGAQSVVTGEGGGWRLQDLVTIVVVGINIGVTLTKLKAVEQKTDLFMAWMLDQPERDQKVDEKIRQHLNDRLGN